GRTRRPPPRTTAGPGARSRAAAGRRPTPSPPAGGRAGRGPPAARPGPGPPPPGSAPPRAAPGGGSPPNRRPWGSGRYTACPALVGVVEGLGHRRDQGGAIRERQPPAPEAFGQRDPLDEFRDEVTPAARGLSDVEDGDDVRVVQLGQGPGLREVGVQIAGRSG